MGFRVDGAVERRDVSCAEMRLQLGERRAARVAQYQIEICEAAGWKVVNRFSISQGIKRYGRVKIVETLECGARVKNEVGDARAVGAVAREQGAIGCIEFTRYFRANFIKG